MLHCFKGDDVEVAGTRIESNVGVKLEPSESVSFLNRGEPAEFLMLQGRPIGAPVFQLGPFVMNSAEELQQAVLDYRRTQFGGWPWDRADPVHPRSDGRFALHADGRVEHRERHSV